MIPTGRLAGNGSIDVDTLHVNRNKFQILGGTLRARNMEVGRLTFLTMESASVEQSGGMVEAETLQVAANNGRGSYRMTGGEIRANSLDVAAGPNPMLTATGTSGDLSQIGGSVHGGQVRVGIGNMASGSYTIAGGRLTADVLAVSVPVTNRSPFPEPTPQTFWGTGRFEIANPDAAVTVSQALSLGEKATFVATPGSTLHLLGADFINQGTDPTALAGLANLRVIAQTGNDSPGGGEQDVVSTFEVAGRDVGATPQGFENNFLLGTLQIGGDSPAYFALVDNLSNHVTDVVLKEALYVDHLILNAGSTLDLNGLKLCARNFTNHGGALLENGGTLTVIPEPATVALLCPLLLTSRRRRA